MVYVKDAEQSGRHFVLIFSGKLEAFRKTTTAGPIYSLSLLRVGFFSIATLVMNTCAYNIHADCIDEVFLHVFQIPGI